MPTRTLRNHRLGGALALGVAVLGGVAAGGATYASYGDWSIEEYHVDATLTGDTLSVVETIDFDFGSDRGHGVERFVDLGIVDQAGQVEIDNITAESGSAPDDLLVTDELGTAVLRVGDPDREVDGLHRYRLGYELSGVPDPAETETGRFVYIAVGDRWEVPLSDVSVRVATDFEPGEVTCSIGRAGSFDSCDATVDDGIVTATVDKVKEGQGVVLEIDPGEAREPAALEPPPLETDSGGEQPLRTAGLVGLSAAAAGVIGALLAGRWARRAGADITASRANPTEAAFAGGDAVAGADGSVEADVEGERISDDDAAEQVTVQFSPPEGLTPPQGAVLERERVDDAASTAWLAQSVIDGWIELDDAADADSPTIRRGERARRDPAHMPAPLGAALDGREELTLGSYDSAFAGGWKAIGVQLDSWKSSSGLWDERHRRRNESRAAVLLFLGLAAAAVSGAALLWFGVSRILLLAIPLVAVAGVLFGLGVRAITAVPTLHVRSSAGYGLWLRTEGFRRFLADSEGQHARWAAERGLLREYSAWAVALGELDRWNHAAAMAGIPPTDPGMSSTLAFVALSTHAHTTSVQPRTSGSGGFGGGGFSGGGFGGGVGGGGGGGW